MNNTNVSIVPVGGRVKSAALGLDFISGSEDPVVVGKRVNQMRKNPPPELLTAFFPRISQIRQMVRGVGLYRPVLKTDQGMPGNFMPFFINGGPDFDSARVTSEEGVAIPESHAEVDAACIEDVQRHFHDLQLKQVFHALQKHEEQERRAEKGRGSFFLIRGAKTDIPPTFGKETIGRVEQEIDEVLSKISTHAQQLEADYKTEHGISARAYEGDNLIYSQPDVFILNDGQIAVEKVNCPDVGLFLTDVNGGKRSSVLAQVKEINGQLGQAVARALAEKIGAKEIAIITRDEVLECDEDVLEINEITALQRLLSQQGIELKVFSAKNAGSIQGGMPTILLNLNYDDPSTDQLLTRHSKGELPCYPNPFFQMAAAQTSGLKTQELSGEDLRKFLELAESNPKNEKGVRDIHARLNKRIGTNGSNIIHADIGTESVPIMRSSLHSFRQIGNRMKMAQKTTGQEVKRVLMRHIPATASNLKITSDTGPRLHTYRFMCISK